MIDSRSIVNQSTNQSEQSDQLIDQSVCSSVCPSICLSASHPVIQSVGQSFSWLVGHQLVSLSLGFLVGWYQKNLNLHYSLSPVLHRVGPTVCLHLTSPVFLTLYHHHHYHFDIHYIFVPAKDKKSYYSTTEIQ